MIYDIRHVTDYEYAAPVADARCLLRLTPLREHGQEAFASSIQITPKPRAAWERQGFFGERITYVDIDAPHTALRIETRARASVTRAPPAVTMASPAWEAVRVECLAAPSLGPRAPAHFLQPSAMAPLHAPAGDYARESFPEGREILEGLIELISRMRADFVFDPHATAISTPLAQTFGQRRGVCQDFAHIAISGLRALGLPAAYVSGYLRTIPPPGSPRLEGADAMHAWVNVWCGEPLGWVGIDPTNALLVGEDHIAVAIGRDYADAAPVQGVFLGFGAQQVAVSVDVTVAQ
ncbi:MAG: transglutaminase N-terminal domain-containing protein [Hyphomonadaceae bacterium]